MSFSQWKPQEPSAASRAFHKDQQVLFRYRKKQVVGTIVRLLYNSAVVTLSISDGTNDSEKTVISYKNLIIT